MTNTLLPDDCRLCGTALVGVSMLPVCESCLGSCDAAQEHGDAFCSRCGDFMGMESARFRAAMGLTECSLCRLAPPAFTRAVAAGEYDGALREMLQMFKFDGRTRMAQYALGERLSRAILTLRGAADEELIVVPVPLSAVRLRRRGYNQATLLAETALRSLKRHAPAWRLVLQSRVLERIKDSRSLYTLNPQQRRRSLQGAFRVVLPQAVAGREVLLIDDILTTGATARECSRVLLLAGATAVWVATVARAQPQRSRSTADDDAPSPMAAGAQWALWDAPPP